MCILNTLVKVIKKIIDKYDTRININSKFNNSILDGEYIYTRT